MNYRWKFKKKHDNDSIYNLAKSLKIPKSLAKVLASRGVKSKEVAVNYFKPSLDTIHDPFLMDDMDKASDRLIEAINNKELIWVHGDYDVDGTSSTALIISFIRSVGGVAEYYIPDRFEDGFGLSKKSVNLALESDAKILLSVDVGITAVEEIKHANENGLFTIICDHHEVADDVPPADAILDPLKPNCKYPFRGLAACGVAFKLAQAIAIKLGDVNKAYAYLDLVAIASIADMVPLLDENRAIVHNGLAMLNKHARPGIKGLLHCTGLKEGGITSSNIVFAIAPLINAAGRLGDAKRSVEMLMSSDELHAFRIAQELEDENRKRRLYDQQTFESSIPKAQKLLKETGARSLVLHYPKWHAGVIGIVASRLVDKFHLPTVLLTTIDGLAKGSARSINNFDIYSALKQCEDLLIEFGGHRHASGLTLREEDVPELRRRFDEIAQTQISHEMLTPEIEIDSELKLNELSPNFLNTLGKFAPYGFSNYKPIFFSKGVKSVNGIKIVGNNSIRFRAIQNNFVIDAIGQNLAHKIDLCSNGKSFSIVYNLEKNNFNGQNSPQLSIKDIRPDE